MTTTDCSLSAVRTPGASTRHGLLAVQNGDSVGCEPRHGSWSVEPSLRRSVGRRRVYESCDKPRSYTSCSVWTAPRQGGEASMWLCPVLQGPGVVSGVGALMALSGSDFVVWTSRTFVCVRT